MTELTRPAGRVHGAMLLYGFLISTAFPVGAAITDDLDPFVITFLRFFLASLVFGLLLMKSEPLVRPGLADILRYGTISSSIIIFFLAMFEALRWTDPLSTGAIFSLLPLISGIIGVVILGVKLRLPQVVFLILGSMGAIWVLFGGSWSRLSSFDIGWGEILFAMGVLSFAAYAPLIRYLHRGETTASLTFWVLTVGAVMLGLLSLPELLATDWPAVPVQVWLWVVYLAVGPTAVTFYLVKYASVQMPPAKVMAYTYLTPSFVLAITAVMSQQMPGGSVLAGTALTIVALILLQRTSD